MTEALKPCPFCKTAPRHLEAKEGFWPERVICDVCHFHLDEENVLSAVSRWNRRATPAPAQPDPLRVANEWGEGWQPIETAPKDGARFLAWKDGRSDFFHYQGRDDGSPIGWRDSFITVYPEGSESAPKFWMPLPAAPKEKP